MKEARVIYMGSDHAGFKTKEKIRAYLEKKKIPYYDFTPEFVDGDDYPDAAFAVSEKVAKTKGARGILVCGSGTGMIIAANKVKGIRAVAPYDVYTARMSKVDNDTNVIAFRGRGFNVDLILRMLRTWLNTEFSGVARHKRRINKISKYEK
jgi:ribose 5-phosphate isomerase B